MCSPLLQSAPTFLSSALVKPLDRSRASYSLDHQHNKTQAAITLTTTWSHLDENNVYDDGIHSSICQDLRPTTVSVWFLVALYCMTHDISHTLGWVSETWLSWNKGGTRNGTGCFRHSRWLVYFHGHITRCLRPLLAVDRTSLIMYCTRGGGDYLQPMNCTTRVI